MILVVAAMQEEIKDVAKMLQPNTHLIVTGVGKVNASRALTEAIQKERIELIFNIGFAGATKPFQVGDLAIVNQSRYHDFNLTMFGYEPGQVPGHPAYFETDRLWYDKIRKMMPDLKEGTLLTGDCFMSGTADEHLLFDMEGAALYQVAHHYQIPMVSIKIVSDVITMDKHIESYQSFEASKGSHILNQVYQTIFGGQK
jgi:adenosylhomocysteine nucleosidase